mmetsp:Transcript_46000/g.76063  ORF Transcript_46000/g.76063 Transcript_46000/m.76063 type:complete len:216 (+) Transcript_46000:290-937(+)
MHIAPLPHAARADEVVAQQRLVLAVGQLVFALASLGIAEPLPQLQVAHELRLLVVELLVLLIGGLGGLLRAVAHVLAGQRGGDHQHLGQRITRARLQDHAAHTRVQRQARQLLPERRQLVVVIGRAQLVEQLVAIGDRLGPRRLQKGEALHVAQMQRLHPQDDAGQAAAQDLGVGEARALVEFLLAVQAHADAVADAAAAAGALVGRGLRNRGNY